MYVKQNLSQLARHEVSVKFQFSEKKMYSNAKKKRKEQILKGKV